MGCTDVTETTTVGPQSPPPAASPYRFLAVLLTIGGFMYVVGTIIITLFDVPWLHIGIGLGVMALGIAMTGYLGKPPEEQ